MATEKQPMQQQPKSGEVQRTPQRRGTMMSPFDEMERMFEGFFPRWPRMFNWDMPGMMQGLQGEARMPAVDVIDRDTEICLRAEVPGINKDDIEITTTENTVTIKGSTHHEAAEEKGDYYRCEISRGAFSRTVALPGDVDSEKAKATFKDGVLELTLPKIERSRRHTIRVQ